MDEQIHFPAELNQRQLARLQEHVSRGQLLSPEDLLRSAYAYLEDVQSVSWQHPEVDAELAASICQVLSRVVAEWELFTPAEQSWLRGALRYFTKSDDAFPDFGSEGFRDDVEVLNACLRFSHREHWVLPLKREST